MSRDSDKYTAVTYCPCCGDHGQVLAYWKRGPTKYRGVVVAVRVAVNDELVYDINYDDGEEESALPEKYVKINKGAMKKSEGTRSGLAGEGQCALVLSHCTFS